MTYLYMGIWLAIVLDNELNANGVGSDQTPRSAASDLGLHCLQTSRLWDARHKWVNGNGESKSDTNYQNKRLQMVALLFLLIINIC